MPATLVVDESFLQIPASSLTWLLIRGGVPATGIRLACWHQVGLAPGMARG